MNWPTAPHLAGLRHGAHGAMTLPAGLRRHRALRLLLMPSLKDKTELIRDHARHANVFVPRPLSDWGTLKQGRMCKHVAGTFVSHDTSIHGWPAGTIVHYGHHYGVYTDELYIGDATGTRIYFATSELGAVPENLDWYFKGGDGTDYQGTVSAVNFLIPRLLWFTWGRTGLRLYIDGVLRDSDAAATDGAYGSGPSTPQLSKPDSTFYTGLLAIWNEELRPQGKIRQIVRRSLHAPPALGV